MRRSITAIAVSTAVLAGTTAVAGEQEAIDGCIDQLRAVGGPDGQSGKVISSEFSEAATLVMLEDRGGTSWRCLAYSDGTVAELTVQKAADDGGGAMAGAKEPGTDTVVVRFEKGASGAELRGTLAPGASTRYVLGARDRQNLYVRVADNDRGLTYQIFNPDQSFLLDQITAGKEYRGELWQSGDHVIEVINRTNATVDYSVIFGID